MLMKCLTCQEMVDAKGLDDLVCQQCQNRLAQKEADELVLKLRGEIERTLDSIPPALSSTCVCGRQMIESNGMWWCNECSVWKVKDAGEMMRHVQTMQIPLYVAPVVTTGRIPCDRPNKSNIPKEDDNG